MIKSICRALAFTFTALAAGSYGGHIARYDEGIVSAFPTIVFGAMIGITAAIGWADSR